MLPNLLDDLLRAWDTHPPTQDSPGTGEAATRGGPLQEKQALNQQPEAGEEPSLPETAVQSSRTDEQVTDTPPANPEQPFVPAFIEPPHTLLPSDPFGKLLAELSATSELPQVDTANAGGNVMDSLLSSLLASFDPPAVDEAPVSVEPPTPPPAPLPPARPSLPSALQAPTGRKFVAVAMGTYRFALPIESVLEVGRSPKITFVPGLAPHVKGVFSFRGEVVPVVNVRKLAGLSDSDATSPDFASENSRIVSVQSANGRSRAALVFDSLEGIVWIDTDAPGPGSSQSRLNQLRESHPLAAALSSVCIHDTTQFALISVDRLLEEAGCTEGVAA